MSPAGRTRAAALAVLALAVAVPGTRLAAASCAEEIDLLASQYALSAELPESPSGTADEKATRGAPPEGGAGVPAAKRRQMQVLLNGARVAHQQGKEAECFQRLSDARAIPAPG